MAKRLSNIDRLIDKEFLRQRWALCYRVFSSSFRMSELSSYDEIAGMYHVLWSDWYLPAAMPALEKLFFSQVAPGSRVLDLCCGSGHVTKELIKHGYSVVGVDLSAELIALARKELPGTEFRVEDARNLKSGERYDAVLSTFDSLNHILTLEDLGKVFAGVRRVLDPSGLFLFDMNLEEAYSADLRDWTADVSENGIGLVRGRYNAETKAASTELIWFVYTGKDQLWKQHRSVVQQQCYSQADIVLAAREAGFGNIEAVPARDAGVISELGYGRVYFVARP